MKAVIFIVSMSMVLIVSPSVQAIPLIDMQPAKKVKKSDRRCNKTCQLEREIKQLKGLLAMIRELKGWARDVHSDLKRVYSDSALNLDRARDMIARAKKQKPSKWIAPTNIEAQMVVASNTSSVPRISSFTIPDVNPDEFYLHCTVNFPPTWVRQQKKVKVSWYIYDHRHLPTASSIQNTNKAIFHKYGYSKPVRSNKVNYYQRVRGLGLLPGRYFVATKVVAASGRYPRPTQVSLGVFRVTKEGVKYVAFNLPHYRKWYQSYKSPLRLSEVKARVKGKGIMIGGKLDHSSFSSDSKPVIIEIIAESGYGSKVIYRQDRRLKRGSEKLKLKLKEHGLKPGAYQLRISVYTEYQAGTKYKYLRGASAFQRIPITIK